MSRASRPVRVGIDATPLLGVRTGVGHVTASLLDALARRTDAAVVAYAITWRGRHHLRELLAPGTTAATRPFPARLTRVLWPRWPIPRIERWTGPVDVVHATNFVAPPARAPVVVTVHDLTFLHNPELCTADARSYQRLLEVALRRGATIHAFSDHVADELRSAFALPHDRVVRIYPGLAQAAGGDPSRGHAIAGSTRYVLTLGTIEPRKNLPRLVQAFDILAAEDHDIALVLAGPDGWGIDELADALASARHRARVVRIGYVDDASRSDLLAGATALAYPSLNEGFGHPPLEAMAAGTPVVASRAGSLPEVLGDAAVFADPFDVEELAHALAAVSRNATLRSQLAARGARRVQRYSWDTAAREVTALYRRLAGEAATEPSVS